MSTIQPTPISPVLRVQSRPPSPPRTITQRESITEQSVDSRLVNASEEAQSPPSTKRVKRGITKETIDYGKLIAKKIRELGTELDNKMMELRETLAGLRNTDSNESRTAQLETLELLRAGHSQHATLNSAASVIEHDVHQFEEQWGNMFGHLPWNRQWATFALRNRLTSHQGSVSQVDNFFRRVHAQIERNNHITRPDSASEHANSNGGAVGGFLPPPPDFSLSNALHNIHRELKSLNEDRLSVLPEKLVRWLGSKQWNRVEYNYDNYQAWYNASDWTTHLSNGGIFDKAVKWADNRTVATFNDGSRAIGLKRDDLKAIGLEIYDDDGDGSYGTADYPWNNYSDDSFGAQMYFEYDALSEIWFPKYLAVAKTSGKNYFYLLKFNEQLGKFELNNPGNDDDYTMS